MEFRSIAKQLNQGEPVFLRTVLEGPEAGTSLPIECPAESGIVQRDGALCYEEEYALPPRLVILGAGHVGQATARLAEFVGFRVTVMDDRPELVVPERFPAGTELQVCDYRALGAVLPGEPVYYLVASSAHTWDYLCAKALLARPHLWLGMIGSRKKAAMIREKLLSDGFTPEEAGSVHSPVGLDIGAETPEEIAVSILAELIPLVRSAPAQALPRDLLKALARRDAAGVLVTVIRKAGSAPRGVGAKLLVLKDGSTVGTVGGGIVEHQAIELAKACTGFTLKTFRSGSGQAGSPVCGGTEELMFQPFDNRI